MKKRVFKLLMALALCLALLPGAIEAARAEDHHYYCTKCKAQMFVMNTIGARGETDFKYVFFKDAIAAAKDGQTVTLTVFPADGYVLDSLTVTDTKGNEIAVTEANGKYSFQMPASRVTVAVVFKTEKAGFPFTDVKEGAYYCDAVRWAYESGITDGYGSSDIFAPTQDCTRAQIVTFLWRAVDAGAATSSFTDVPKGSYYEGAVGWAQDTGLTDGVGGGKFGPTLTCQRAQIVTLLYRALAK